MIPYAVIKTSGRQYRVSAGDSLSVEKLDGNPGDKITITEVLMIGGEKLLVGAPHVSGATVTVVIERQFRGEKVLVYKKKRRHKYRKMRGHRSELTRLFVTEIASAGASFKAEGEPNVWDAARIEARKVAASEAQRERTRLARLAVANGEEPAVEKPAKKAASAKKGGAAKKKSVGKKKAAPKKAATKKAKK